MKFNSKLYNSMKGEQAKIKKEVYGRKYNTVEDIILAASYARNRDDDKIEAVYQAMAWTIETGRIAIAKLVWLETAKGGEMRKMFENAAASLADDLSMGAAKDALYVSIPA